MTTVTNYQMPADKEQIVEAFFAFSSPHEERTAGMEQEYFILRADGGLMRAEETDKLYMHLKAILGDRVSTEPGAHLMEVKTGVHTNAQGIKDDLNASIEMLKFLAAEHGMVVSKQSDLPQFSQKEISENAIGKFDPETGKVRRGYEVMQAYRKHGLQEFSTWTTSTVSIQFTHNVRDVEQLLRWGRVHSALSPLHYVAFENRERTEGKYHEGIRMRRALGKKGLLAPHLFEAQDGRDFARRHVDRIYGTVLMMTLDDCGYKMLDRPTLFQDLPISSQTLGNFMQGASSNFTNTKIRTIVDGEAAERGDVKFQNMLIEARDMDTSERGTNAVADWFCDLTVSDTSLAYAEATLEELGIPILNDPLSAMAKIDKALRAVECDPGFLTTVFGHGTLRELVESVCLPLSGEKSAAFWTKSLSCNSPPCRMEIPVLAAQSRPEFGSLDIRF